jgi:hypothetical protein
MNDVNFYLILAYAMNVFIRFAHPELKFWAEARDLRANR